MDLTDQEKAFLQNLISTLVTPDTAIDFISLTTEQQQGYIGTTIDQCITDLNTAISNISTDASARQVSLQAQIDTYNSLKTKLQTLSGQQ